MSNNNKNNNNSSDKKSDDQPPPGHWVDPRDQTRTNHPTQEQATASNQSDPLRASVPQRAQNLQEQQQQRPNFRQDIMPSDPSLQQGGPFSLAGNFGGGGGRRLGGGGVGGFGGGPPGFGMPGGGAGNNNNFGGGGGMMMGPRNFPGNVGGAGSTFGGAGFAGGGQPRFDPIGPNIRDPEIIRGMENPNYNNNNNHPSRNNNSTTTNVSRTFTGEPDNDALQPQRFGEDNVIRTDYQQRPPETRQVQNANRTNQTANETGTSSDAVPPTNANTTQQDDSSKKEPLTKESDRGCLSTFSYF